MDCILSIQTKYTCLIFGRLEVLSILSEKRIIKLRIKGKAKQSSRARLLMLDTRIRTSIFRLQTDAVFPHPPSFFFSWRSIWKQVTKIAMRFNFSWLSLAGAYPYTTIAHTTPSHTHPRKLITMLRYCTAKIHFPPS